METKTQTLNNLLIDVLNKNEKVDVLISLLKSNANIAEDEKYAYQALCCALLARDTDKMLQKGEFIQAYYKYICQSLAINSNCYTGRLFRFIVEKSLTNVDFVNHNEEDKIFLEQNYATINDTHLIELTNKTLER